MSRQLVACLLNVSEGRKLSVVENIARAALRAVNPPTLSPVHSDWQINATVLNIFQDIDYHRSVITIVANKDNIGACVAAACSEAYKLIDLSEHDGVHPRLGAVDLVPFHPISENMSLQSLGRTAVEVGRLVTSTTPGSSVFLFGDGGGSDGGDGGAARGLVQRRKEVGWFRRPVDYSTLSYDLGAKPSSRYGLTGMGAVPYMMNVNLTLDTSDLAVGRRVAAALRATSPGGLPGVQSMAFPHEGRVEVACNVELLPPHLVTQPQEMKSCLGGEYLYTPAEVIERRVLSESGGVRMLGTTLIGFTPDQARSLALNAFSTGLAEAWRSRQEIRM